MSNRFSSITLMSTLFIASIGASLVGGCSSSSDGSSDATLTIVNAESFDIDHIYIDSVGDEDFTAGLDLLDGMPPLTNGETITVSAACDSYDIEIVDESGADCIIQDYALCASDNELDITDSFCGLSARVGSNQSGPVTHSPAASHAPVARNVSLAQ
jgi:hypothetical protein